MTASLRKWATPLTMGAFCLMSITGILIFFHLDSGYNKTAHEWLGWFLIIGVAGHAVANWPSMKRYFATSILARIIVGIFIILLGLSFIQGTQSDRPPPVLAMQAIVKAPLSQIAPLTGKSVDKLIADLSAAGITATSPDSTIANAVQGNRELQGKAMFVLFGQAPQKATD